MSLILDALNRSNRDSSPVPSLDTYHPVERAANPWRSRLLWVALGIACALIIWLLLGRGAKQVTVAPEPAGLATEVAQISPGGGRPPANRQAAPATASVPASTPVPAPAAAKAQTPVEAPVAAPLPATDIAQAPAADDAGTPPGGSNEAIQKLYEDRASALAASRKEARAQQAKRKPEKAVKAAPVEQAAKVREQPVDIEKMLSEARSELENKELAEHSAPFIARLSQQAKNDIPTILYARHDYSGQSGQGTVVMNGKTLRAGGSPAPGVKIDEILPTSTVLSFRGTQFRLRALNSWVNL